MALAANLVQIGIQPRHADFLGDTQSASVAAAGSASQANATQLTATVNRITSSTAASAEDVKLPLISSWKGTFIFVRNDTANNCVVYPGVGDSINSLAANLGIQINAGSGMLFAPVSSTKWVST